MRTEASVLFQCEAEKIWRDTSQLRAGGTDDVRWSDRESHDIRPAPRVQVHEKRQLIMDQAQATKLLASSLNPD